jgi:hypothetical protein
MGRRNRLGDDTYGRVTVSAAVGVISVVGQSLTDYARGGSAVESVQYNFRKLADAEADESQVLVLATDGRTATIGSEPAARTTPSFVTTGLTPIRRIRCQAAWSLSSRQSLPN